MARVIPSDIGDIAFDAIIIGAGINGAGIASDAALRGLKVLLLDKGDIASGTTSWSTRLVHGGLRYLEYGEINLVRESLRERERLLHLAPHLVKPLAMLIPIYEDGARNPLTIRAGMIAYDLLSLDKSLDHHHILTRDETLRRVPGLNLAGLRGAAVYYDAQIEYAERLAVENALSAREHGAHVITYARVDRLLMDERKIRGVEFTDMLSDGSSSNSARSAHAPVVLNVAGPWVDEVLANLDASTERMIGGTKGSHLVVGAFAGAPDDALYVEARDDGRPFFIIPWNDQYLIGTTDTRYAGDLDHVAAGDAEIDYLLRETNRVIPEARLTRRSINYTYSGVRPLARGKDNAASAITRRHFIHDHAPALDGFLSIIGGKLTTYRNLSEQAVNLIFRKLNRSAFPCTTTRTPLPGASVGDFSAWRKEFIASCQLPKAVAARLVRIYGTRASRVLELCEENAELKEAFSPHTGAIGAEVVLSFRDEMAETLADCLLRRTMVGLDASVGLDAVERAAAIACQHLGWSRERAAQEIVSYRKYIERMEA